MGRRKIKKAAKATGEKKVQKAREVRRDGYQNLLNKYGTKNDVSENYRFVSDEPVSDVELTLNYEGNGLFARIIDIPADEAVSSGFTYGISDTDIENLACFNLT